MFNRLFAGVEPFNGLECFEMLPAFPAKPFYATRLAFSGRRSASVSAVIGSFTCEACWRVLSTNTAEDYACSLSVNKPHTRNYRGPDQREHIQQRAGRVQGSITNFIMGLKAL